MKLLLLNTIKAQLDEKIQVALQAMKAAQESANAETKSSAGDKYETGRAMGQIERDMHAQQYEKLKREKDLVERIDPNMVFERVGIGALVKTTAGLFFIANSVGNVKVEAQNYMVISAQSPIGALLMGKKATATFIFQQKQQTIEEIF